MDKTTKILLIISAAVITGWYFFINKRKPSQIKRVSEVNGFEAKLVTCLTKANKFPNIESFVAPCWVEQRNFTTSLKNKGLTDEQINKELERIHKRIEETE